MDGRSTGQSFSPRPTLLDVAAATRRALLISAASLVALPVALARAGDPGAADEPLQRLYAAIQQSMRAGSSTSFRQRFETLAPVVEQVFDLETVLRISVGTHWSTMAPETRAQLLRAYRQFTVATYVANFDKDDGEHFRILPGSRTSGSDRIINTEIVQHSGPPIRIDYVLRDEQGSWRVVDILLDGSISRVAVQRSDFRKILENGNAQALIDNLRKKTADLSDGALNS